MKSTILTAIIISTALAFLSSAAAYAATTGQSARQYVDDSAITAAVKAKLVADKLANFTRVEVDTTNGVVTLNGVVDSLEQKTHVEQIAMQVGGVQRVDNNLEIQKRN
jgi:hyperosmotically inducible periplasmic protein